MLHIQFRVYLFVITDWNRIVRELSVCTNENNRPWSAYLLLRKECST